MKKICTLTILLLLAVTASMGQVAEDRIKIKDLRIEDLGEMVEVKFSAEIAPKAVKRNHTLVFMPVITNQGYSQSLSPIVVRGKGSKVARARREWVAKKAVGYEDAVYTENGKTIDITATVPLQKWMWGSDLIFECVEGGCCSYNKLNDVLYAGNILVMPEPEPVPEPAVVEPEPAWTPVSTADSLSTAFAFVVPASEFDEDEPFKIYDDDRENSLIVYFQISRHGIDPAYMENAHTLANLTATINMIMESKDSRVDKIIVGGFTSPEGGFQLNDRLAFERAVTVKKYIIEKTGIKDHQVLIYNGSADWQGLRAMVAKSYLPEKRQILSIIDNTPIWDSKRQVGRLGELMRLNGGTTYRYLFKEYFPYLRNGAFIRVYYENK